MVSFMSENQKDPQYKLRWSEELRDKVTASAKDKNRSINAEITTRLEESFDNASRNQVDFESGYKTAMTHTSLALGRVLSEKGIEWSEIQKIALFMLDEAEKIRRTRQKN